jgi:hypothetical protein
MLQRALSKQLKQMRKTLKENKKKTRGESAKIG